MKRDDTSWQFLKNSDISEEKSKNFVVFALTYVLEMLALLHGYFDMNSFSIDSDEAMKQDNEALNASWLQFQKH
jgi:hypothetical protein